jgi:hypothetical protein
MPVAVLTFVLAQAAPVAAFPTAAPSTSAVVALPSAAPAPPSAASTPPSAAPTPPSTAPAPPVAAPATADYSPVVRNPAPGAPIPMYGAELTAPMAPVTRPPERRGTSFKGTLGGFYQQLFDVPLYGGGGSLAIGPYRRNSYLYFVFELEYGRTNQGLSTWALHLGFAPEWTFDRFHAGFQLGLAYLQLDRATRDASLASFTLISGAVKGSVDLATFGDSALFLEAKFRLDEHFPVVWGPTLALGFRTDSL